MDRNNYVKVWDLPVRICHWGLVLFFTVAFVSQEGPEAIHVFAGYVVAGLVILRIIWGFAGTGHARFSDFLYGPSEVAAYLKSILSGRPRHYYGHNPAGAWMIFLLLASLILTSWTGLKAYASEGGGPLALDTPSVVSVAYADGGDDNGDGHEFWEEVHEVAAFFNLFLVAVHITGAIVASLIHRENLILAMITGRKPRHGG